MVREFLIFLCRVTWTQNRLGTAVQKLFLTNQKQLSRKKTFSEFSKLTHSRVVSLLLVLMWAGPSQWRGMVERQDQFLHPFLSLTFFQFLDWDKCSLQKPVYPPPHPYSKKTFTAFSSHFQYFENSHSQTSSLIHLVV